MRCLCHAPLPFRYGLHVLAIEVGSQHLDIVPISTQYPDPARLSRRWLRGSRHGGHCMPSTAGDLDLYWLDLPAVKVSIKCLVYFVPQILVTCAILIKDFNDSVDLYFGLSR